MNPLQLMELHKSNFTPNDECIYQYITKHLEEITQMTTSTLAKECNVSQPALSRFIKNLGFNRYQDFRGNLIAWLAQNKEQTKQNDGHLRYFGKLHQIINETETLLTKEYITELVQYLSQFKRIFTTGVGKSFQPARLFEILMIKTDRYVHAVSRDTLHEICDYMGPDDLLLIFSANAKAEIMDYAIGCDGKILLVTANKYHNYQNIVDRTVALPYIPPSPEESSISPIMFDVFTELLADFLTLDKFSHLS